MKKNSTAAYKRLFLKHVFRFISSVTSQKELAGPHVIAVSGGVDSMVLLWLAQQLFSESKMGPFRALFIHHHTRPGQDFDAELIQDYCQDHQIEFDTLHAHGLEEREGNFEERARQIRRSLLLENLRPNELLWLGHHLDDSYEWSMMQRHRSSRPHTSLGIPVRNGRILRPFLCVTKKQLMHLSQIERIIFREDPTNLDTKFDRNFLRQDVIPLIKKRYPQYLKHYVYHANHMASIMDVTVSARVSGPQIHIYQQGAIVCDGHFSSFQIQELLHSFSRHQRGKMTSQVLKMLKAIDNGKKGPFHFSGGTEAYYSHKLLMIYQQKMKNYDESIADILHRISDDELEQLPLLSWKDLDRSWENLLKTSDAMLNMPGLVLILETDSIKKTFNSSVNDTLFPQVSQLCQQRKLRFMSCLKCLEQWKSKKEKLPVMLRLLPLWTLSNLFSFQE